MKSWIIAGVLSLLGAAALPAQVYGSLFVSAEMEPMPWFADPGLSRTAEVYNESYPGLSTPLGTPASLLGLGASVGFSLSTHPYR